MLFKKKFLLIIYIVFYSCGDGSYIMYGSGSCGGYGNQKESLYILPYAVGEEYLVSQANCSNFSHKGSSMYAYDFSMPIGTAIFASRTGVVVNLKVNELDDNQGTAANYLMIKHVDGSVAIYAHLTYQGSVVALNDFVEQGDLIAYSGNTGYSTGPHLHFEVIDVNTSLSLPINFKNTSGNPEGLKKNNYYTALPFVAVDEVFDIEYEHKIFEITQEQQNILLIKTQCLL